MGININITASGDKGACKAEASGSIQHIVTDQERKTFGINDGALKNAIGKYFGKNPNDAYVHSPTPWGDLYKTHRWAQVQTVLVPVRAEILGITSVPDILATKTFSNKSTVKGTFNASISQEITNTVGSTWSTGGTLSISEALEVGVDIEIIKGKSTTTIGYSQSWDVGGSKSKSSTVGSESGVSVELDPGQSIEAQLSASKGTMKVRVTYKAVLQGSVAVNYDPTFKDHHFWALPISNIMSAGGMSNEVISTEDLDIGFYSNGKVEIKNTDGTVLRNIVLADRRA